PVSPGAGSEGHGTLGALDCNQHGVPGGKQHFSTPPWTPRNSVHGQGNGTIANQEFLQLLKRLGLESHYPKKMEMGYSHTICKTSLQNREPSKDKELPFYFLQKLLTVDYRVRYLTCCDKSNPGLAPMPQTSEQEQGLSDSFENFLDNLMEAAPEPASRDGCVHPMDLQMAIFHCADDFLRQTLANKLAFCQLALPLLVPNPGTSHIEFPLYALSQIQRSWKEADKLGKQAGTKSYNNKLISQAQTPIVSFIRIGSSASCSKSQLLNALLSKRKHDTFFHRHCRGSTRERLLMEGVVEIAWYYARDHRAQLQFLQEISAVNVALVSESERMDNRGKQLLQGLWQSQRPLVCLLTEKENVARNCPRSNPSCSPSRKTVDQWCKKDKELTRLQEKGNKSIEHHRSKLKTRRRNKKKAMEQAFPLNLLMKSFLGFLQAQPADTKKYFLHWMKVFMESCPAIALKNCREIITNMSVGSISEEINDSSIGLEHLLREVGQIYEALQLMDSEKFKFSKLPEIAADLMVSGYPVELMDGDASYVPLRWVEAIFDSLIERLGDKRVFVLSVLGIQSTGKSTLLNTMFGLQFNVSAGRCTRGAFMQLIPVSEELQQDVGFDFVLVVDTEGLRAIEMANKHSLNHDNELATFVIGIGNLTVINIFGENPSEMQDVLQIAVQAFLRMKKVNLSPSCLFVHQNVGEITAKEKNMEGQRRLQEKLDEMTVIAAQQEFCDISSFSDVIGFDVNTHIHYFAHLWEGNPPMAPPNPTYSQNVQQLKSKILQAAKKESQHSILNELLRRS
uniref:VLIG-type G domain-containing protein n=1 Tax=Malurus cyaneus samueli TaxID=2593467 RepID=A0A8C5U7A8_9PASS